MKPALLSAMAGAALCALAGPAGAYTINGVIPPGRAPVVIALRRPIRPGVISFEFSAPRVNAGVPYAVDFCLGPRANPCGLPGARVVNVPEGQSRSAAFSSILLTRNVLVAGQGTRVAVPFSVTVN